ncbi:putative integral membrane protein [Botrytis fragariae]|uniref:Putative integral membrane protein n=1 Tax=Botrytis fragariae TaxID=1964551 RepID=A0A8H6EIB0_9HELO|nr:putative integral membrane protein [Botrytis fragariae]KAF5872910.1 putative integral membrane protein [Botrytis fragariae]
MAVTPIQFLVSSLPPEVLAKIPAIAAPLGVTSNLVNPTSRGWILAIVSSILAGLMIICYSIRVYTRLAIQRKFDTYHSFGHLDLVLICQQLGALVSAKFDRLQWMKICVFIGATLSSLFYLAITVVQFYLAMPFNGETWKSHIISARTLIGITFSVPAAAVGLGIDVYLFILSLIAAIRLHLPTRKRIPAMMIFNVGLLVCMGSALSIYYRTSALCYAASYPCVYFSAHTDTHFRGAHTTNFTDESKQEPAMTRPAPTEALGRNLYPNLGMTSLSNFEGSGFSSRGFNGLSTQPAGENLFPIATHELRY